MTHARRLTALVATLLTLALVMLYAASDEFHQRFVPSRDASAVDVMIDTGGAVLALFLVWWMLRVYVL